MAGGEDNAVARDRLLANNLAQTSRYILMSNYQGTPPRAVRREPDHDPSQ